MFIDFFFTLKEAGVPVSPTAFLTLHRAIDRGLVQSQGDFYVAARSILVKREKHFDLYDRVFAHIFAGAELSFTDEDGLDLMAHAMLDEWLKDPQTLAKALDIDQQTLAGLTPDKLLDYFKKRLQDQQERHAGGSKWIGTGGTSPVGHSGYHPGGLRTGGMSRHKSALKVAGERRYKNYSADAPLSQNTIGEALKRLRHLVPMGAKDQLDVDGSIYQTIKNGGEIELVFKRSLTDRLKVILAIDNGGWSMEPYVDLVQTLFSYAKTEFKDLKTYYFHNTIYDLLWEDPGRHKHPVLLESFSGLDPDTRLIILGDASMAPYELMSTDGSIYAFERSGRPSIERLQFLAETLPRSVWLNPIPRAHWQYTRTITSIGALFPMFEFSLDGLEQAVTTLMTP